MCLWYLQSWGRAWHIAQHSVGEDDFADIVGTTAEEAAALHIISLLERSVDLLQGDLVTKHHKIVSVAETSALISGAK